MYFAEAMMPAFEKYVIADASAKLRQSGALASNFLSVSNASNPGVFVRARQGSIIEYPAPSTRFRGPRSNKSAQPTSLRAAAGFNRWA